MTRESPFLTQEAAADFLGGLSTKTLERWRIDGCGPAYRKLGRRVFYALNDLIEFADAQRRRSTSEPNVGPDGD